MVRHPCGISVTSKRGENGVWPFFRAAPNCGHNRVLRLCVSIGYSTTGKAGGYVRNATAARCPEKLPRPWIGRLW